MTRRSRELLGKIIIFAGISIVFASFMIALSPRFSFLGRLVSANDLTITVTKFKRLPDFNFVTRFVAGAFIFTVAALFSSLLSRFWENYAYTISYAELETTLFNTFVNRLRFCYTRENLIEAVRQELEMKADCSALITNMESSIVIYNSPSAFVSEPETYTIISQRFSEEWLARWTEGVYFFDSDIALTSTIKTARGVLLVHGPLRFFIICRYIRMIEPEVFPRLYAEFKNYYAREKTLSQLLYYSELAQEWQMVANTQRAFLPQKIPELDLLDIGVYFRPLINVSGDYYDIIPIDKNKTLIVVGDVSGKGLAAALVMGVVVNTIRIMKNKEDLKGLIYAVDTAIKRMNLLDKYTVMFLGLIDTQAMKIRYVNASMESPMILTKASDGYRVKLLESTCSIVGIIDIDSVGVEEKPLYRNDLIIMTSDGIPESTNEKGEELGETDDYINGIKSFAAEDCGTIVNSIADLGLNFSAKKAFRDDITIVAVKLKG